MKTEPASVAVVDSIAPVAQTDDRHVCIVGLGYIGLPTTAMFAAVGLRVTGVDVNPRVLEAVNAGRTS